MVSISGLASLNTYNQLNKKLKAQKDNMEKLSTGDRINSAADDAAGMSISQKLLAQSNGLEQAERNIQDSNSLMQTSDSAMGEIADLLQRMRELSIQGANDTNTEKDKDEIREELIQLKDEIQNIATDTTFNNMPLIDGTFSQKDIEVTAEQETDLTLPADGSIITQSVEIGDFMVDFNFRKISSEEVEIKVTHAGKLLGEKIINQDPLKWEKTYGGSAFDNAEDIVKTQDGGYVLVGRTESSDGDLSAQSVSSSDIWAIKLDESGQNIEWQKTLGQSSYDEGISVEETDNGEILISATRTNIEHYNDTTAGLNRYIKDEDQDIGVYRLESDGKEISSFVLGGGNDQGKAVTETSDGGYLVAANSTSTDREKDILLMKFDSAGEYQWEAYYGADNGYNDNVNDIKEVFDAAGNSTGYILAGDNGSKDLTYKIDLNGQKDWSESFAGDTANAVNQTFAAKDGNHNGYILTGLDSDQNMVIKTDKDGVEQWKIKLGDAGFDQGSNIEQVFNNDGSSNGYIISGTTTSANGDQDISAIKITDDGDIEWELADSTFGGNGDEANTVEADIQTTSDEGYLITDSSDTTKDNYIYKFNKDGSYSWHHKFADDLKIEAADEYQNEIIVHGQDSSANNWIAELNSDGSQKIAKFNLPAGADLENIENIEKTSDKSYLISGFNSAAQKSLVKLNPDQSLDWQRDLSNRSDEAGIIRKMDNGNYIVASNKTYLDGELKGSILKLNSNGDILSEESYDDLSFSENDQFKDLSDGIIISSTSRTNSNKTLTKIADDGSQINYEFPSDIASINTIEIDNAGNYLVSAENSSGNTVISSISSDLNTKNWSQTITAADTFTTADGGLVKIKQAADTAAGTGAKITKIAADGSTIEFENKELGTETLKLNDVIKNNDNSYTLVGKDDSGTKIYQFDNKGENVNEIDSSTFNLTNIEKVKEVSNGFVIIGVDNNGDKKLLKTNSGFTIDNSYLLTNLNKVAEISENSSDSYQIRGTNSSGELVILNTDISGLINDQSYKMTTTDNGNTDVTAAVSNLNNKLWDTADKNLGGTGENARTIKATSDGGYLIANSVKFNTNPGEINALVKYDSLGKIEWEHSLNDDSQMDSIHETKDSYFISEKESDGHKRITQISKNDGTAKWSKVFKGDEFESISKNNDGGYLIGIADNNYRKILKVDSSGDTSWSHRLDNQDESASSIKQTADGGYIISGTKEYNDNDQDANLIKINSAGEMEWEKRLTGSTALDQSSAVEVVNEGGNEYYLVSGTKNGNSWLSKIGTAGNEIWNKTYNGIEATDIRQDSNGDYLLSGTEITADGDKNATVTKIDSTNGSKVWQQSYGGGDDSAGIIKETHDGGYILSGTKTSNRGDTDKIIIKVDKNGDREWERTFDNLRLDDQGFGVEESVIHQSHGPDIYNYVITGTTKDSSDSDIWMMRLNEDGTDNWSNPQTYGGIGDDQAANVQWTEQGTYIISGTQTTTNGDTDIFAAEVNRNDGSIIWEQSIGGSGNEKAAEIIQVQDGGFVVAGSSNSGDFGNNTNNGSKDLLLAKLDKSGNLKWSDLLGGSGDDIANSITEISDGNYVVAGQTTSGDSDFNTLDGDVSFNNGGNDTWVLNYSQGVTTANFYPEHQAEKDSKYGHGTSWLDLDKVGIDFNWKDFSVKKIAAAGNQITKANFVTQDDHTGNVQNHLWAEIDNMRTDELGLDKGVWSNQNDYDFNKSINILDQALSKVSSARSKVGSYQNRLSHTASNVRNTAINLQTANSRISDADIAKKQLKLTRNQILSQSAMAMLAQSKVQGQYILQLLN